MPKIPEFRNSEIRRRLFKNSFRSTIIKWEMEFNGMRKWTKKIRKSDTKSELEWRHMALEWH